MLILSPKDVRFGSRRYDDVELIVLERLAIKTVREATDAGPFPAFVDVPQQRAVIRVRRRLVQEDVEPAILGATGEISFRIGPHGTDVIGTRVAMSAVLIGARLDLSPGPTGPSVPTQVLEFEGVSASGEDPVVMSAE